MLGFKPAFVLMQLIVLVRQGFVVCVVLVLFGFGLAELHLEPPDLGLGRPQIAARLLGLGLVDLLALLCGLGNVRDGSLGHGQVCGCILPSSFDRLLGRGLNVGSLDVKQGGWTQPSPGESNFMAGKEKSTMELRLRAIIIGKGLVRLPEPRTDWTTIWLLAFSEMISSSFSRHSSSLFFSWPWRLFLVACSAAEKNQTSADGHPPSPPLPSSGPAKYWQHWGFS